MKADVYYPITSKKQKPDKCPCGSTEKLHAHHPDYSVPKEVMWMCASCHFKLHKNRAERNEIVYSERFAEYRKKLKENNISMIALAIEMNVSYAAIRSWFQGLTTPNEENMKRLKQVLGVE